MILDDWQVKFLKTKGDKVLCCGRQIGKSTICGEDGGEYAIKNSKKTILMIAPTERQAYALFEKTLSYIIEKDKKLIAKGKNKPTKHKITLTNGTKIFCLPVGTAGLGIRFLTVHRLYADECSRIPEDVWTAVTPMLLTTGGDSIFLSTPAGPKGYFADVVVNKDAAFNSFTRFAESSEAVIRRRKICDTWTEWQLEKALQHLAREKARKSAREYAQEYEGLIVEDLFRYFSDKLIEKVCILQRRETIVKERRYYLGMDIARMGEDETTYEVIDKLSTDNLIHVESIVATRTLSPETINRIMELERLYNFKQIFIDAYNVGTGIFDFLITDSRTKWKTIAIDHWARPLTRDEKKRIKIKPEDLYDNLLSLMEKGHIKLLDDENLKASLRSIQYEYDKGKLRIFGNNKHIADGLVRATWNSKDKSLNIWIDSF